MAQESEYVTVYRTADPSAREDAEAVRSLLVEGGLDVVVLGDDSPGIFEGSVEVRVPGSQVREAEALIAESAHHSEEEDEETEVDPSHRLDEEVIFRAMGTTAEMEAQAVHSILKSYNIPSFVIGPSVLPNLSFLVVVPREQAERAKQAIEEAKAAGPEAAEAGAEASERGE